MPELVDVVILCKVCGEPCNKSIGSHQQTRIRFWGGAHHGPEKVFYRGDITHYFCSEDCRTYHFFGGGEAGPVQEYIGQ